MKAHFLLESKELKQYYYACPSPGNYALDNNSKDYHWDYCREQFAAKLYNSPTPYFYFSHPEKKGEDIANFIVKFENILGIDQFSVFAKTGRNEVLWINPSEFWLDCYLKQSLYTIILRCGINYKTEIDNFDDALFGSYKECDYVNQTKVAILRFMFGFTEYCGDKTEISSTANVIKHGWKEEFNQLNEVAVKKLLGLPKNKIKENNVIGPQILWT